MKPLFLLFLLTISASSFSKDNPSIVGEATEEEQTNLLDLVDRTPQPNLGKKALSIEDVRVQSEANERAEAEGERNVSYRTLYSAAWQQESALSQLIWGGVSSKVEPDPNWKITKEEMIAWMDGIEERFHDSIYEATSAKHAIAIKEHLLEVQERDKIIDSHGVWTGMGARAIFDPATWIAIFLVWFILKKSYGATKKIASKVGEKYRKTASKVGKEYSDIKDKQAEKKVRELAEVTAMTEIIKEEIKNSTPKELSQLKNQIAEAIENGDNEKAYSLLNIAERLKKLDD